MNVKIINTINQLTIKRVIINGLFLGTFLPLLVFSQSKKAWQINDPFIHNVFIENVGQFTDHLPSGKHVLASAKLGKYEILFDETGFSYKFRVPNKEKEAELIDEYKQEQEELEKVKNNRTNLSEINDAEWHQKEMKREEKMRDISSLYDIKYLRMEWLSSNSSKNIRLENADEVSYNYSSNQTATAKVGESLNTIRARGFQKLVYENLYDGVDVEFYIRDGGLKYNLIVHSGGDPSVIKMQYTGAEILSIDSDGNILIKSIYDIQDKAPISYQGNGEEISSSFQLDGNVVSFQIGSYDSSKRLIVDPFQKAFTLPGVSIGLHVKSDNAGNVYVFGRTGTAFIGVAMEIQKYDPSGTLLWSFNNVLLSLFIGSMEVEKTTGASFISLDGRVWKLDTDGNLEWMTSYVSDFSEAWGITYNDTQDELVISGLRENTLTTTINGQMIIDPATGNMVGPIVDLTSIIFSFNNEVRATAPIPGGAYVHMSLSNFELVNPDDLSLCYMVDHNHGFDYRGPMYDGTGNATVLSVAGSNNGIVASRSFIYTTNGDSLNQWNLIDGSYVRAVKIPGGTYEGGSGVLIDTCGDVFVGSNSGVFKFDENLVFVDSVTLNGVYGLDFTTNGEILATGNGYVASLDFENCGPILPNSLIDEDLTTLTMDTSLCLGDSIQLIATGGTDYVWSPTLGLDNPNSATPFAKPTRTTTYSVTITVPSTTSCETITVVDSVTVIVENLSVNSSSSSICEGDTVVLTVVGGDVNTMWTPTTGLSMDTGNTVFATPTATTTYTATGVSNLGCMASFTVVVNPLPIIEVNSDTSICEGATVNLQVTGADSYMWTPSVGLSTNTGPIVVANPSTTTTYTVTGTNNFGCSNEEDVTIGVDSRPLALFDFELDTCVPFQLLFINTGTGEDCLWDFGDGSNSTICDPIQLYEAGGTYEVILTVTNSNCADTTSRDVLVDNQVSCNPFIPNVFSPNGDDANDEFRITLPGLELLNMKIYNRWGLLVYETTTDAAWNGLLPNGEDAPTGTYFYVITTETGNGEVSSYEGTVTLFR